MAPPNSAGPVHTPNPDYGCFGVLRDDMPTITGSRKMVWPSLCAAMDTWSKQLVVDRAVILHIERTRWKQHEECYVHNMLGICLGYVYD